ncbi:Avirulence (Avh) protein [Phytophthora megakarya]|uniref:Avirulence (Avh) protein n=1 Tax=Phytophthora megakarya TaxID=4795 RepID=A0A225X4A2_9STRA|nr:Avirulence (Avh) protein [Phytophthora megakarya]
MCLQYWNVVLLAIIVVLGGTNATVLPADSKLSDTSLSSSIRFYASNQLYINLHRNLRTEPATKEERGVADTVIKKAATVVKPSLVKGNAAEKANLQFRLIQAGDDLFDNPKFLKWIKYVDDFSANNPKEAVTTIPILTARYGDEGLLKMLGTAQANPNTKEVATKLLGQQAQHWAVNGKTPDEVFMLFNMNIAGDKVFENAQWGNWVNYVKTYNTNNPKTQTSVISSLQSIYGESYLVNILAAAGQIRATKSTSKKMELELIQIWLKNDRTTDDVFKLLELDKAANKVLGSPQLAFWGRYVGYVNEKQPDKTTSLIATLTTHYKSKGVVKMLEAAKKVPATKAVATRLQTEQLQHWLSIGKAPANVFKLFKLDEAGENLLSNPQFLVWRKYTDDYGVKNPKARVTTIGVLTRYYQDDVLANLIITGMKSPRTQPTATRLQSELFKSWMPIAGLPPVAPETAFKILKLDEMAEKAFATPMFAFWKKYMEHYNKVISQPDHKKRATLISTLMANYNDNELVLVLEKLEKAPSMQLSVLGKNLKTELLHQLLLMNLGPSDVAKILNAKRKTDANWNLLEKYTKDYYRLVKLREELKPKTVW